SRSCCTVQSAVGCLVTLECTMRREPEPGTHKALEIGGRHSEEVDRDHSLDVILHKGPPVFRRRAIYLPTLVSLMSMPSLSSSPWMRGAPQSGFSRLILRISSRTSGETDGRPGCRRRTFQVPNNRKPLLCEPITVSRLTKDPRRAPVAPKLGKPCPQ